MNLAPGKKLGPYEILSPLGKGGMGEVYRARDTRLGRDVAIKVLPQHLSQNPEVRARFEREAKTISSLNHPNICTLHDVGREGDIDYLVMELIDGQTLADRLVAGALPVADTLRIAGQIADALDRAHRAGVVHRDLKPGNIMLTKTGAKLMDFGLARATGMTGPAGESGVTVQALTQSPTVGQPLTAEGTIVGTFQYMSPEQLEGKETDARSDLWAFGCVVYEMATGKRAFEGKSQASLIGAIMHAEPAPISQIAPMAPPELDRLVRACLIKDADDRVQSAHDLKLQMKWLAEGGTSSTMASAPPIPARRGGWMNYAGVALAAAVVTGALVWFVARSMNEAPSSSSSAQLMRVQVVREDLIPSSAPMFLLDGTGVVYSVITDAGPLIHRRAYATMETAPLAGTEGGSAPFLSPDGAWIGFLTETAIKKIPVSGGVAQTVLGGVRANSADWGRDGMIYFGSSTSAVDRITAIERVSATGGRPETVAELDTTRNESTAWLPEILDDGTLLFTVVGAKWTIKARLPDGTQHVVVEPALMARHAGPGRIAYFDPDAEAIFVAPFDAKTARITGDAIPLAGAADPNHGFDLLGNNVAYVPLSRSGTSVVWLAGSGSGSSVAVPELGVWSQPRLSQDGRRLVMRKVSSDCELWIYDFQQKALARIMQGGDIHDPVWSPDGTRVVYHPNAQANAIMMLSVTGASDPSQVLPSRQGGTPTSWSEGGNRLMFTRESPGTRDIWSIVMDGKSQPEPFIESDFDEGMAAISRDGKWVAYASNETSTQEVHVRPFPGTGYTWRISTGGGKTPVWSRDGRTLYYVSGSKIMSVPVRTEPSFSAGDPGVVQDGGFDPRDSRDFVIGPDGRLIGIQRAEGAAGGQEIQLILNWPAALPQARAGH
jgi:serine/threonine protein kinase